jgi:hypothetical protein
MTFIFNAKFKESFLSSLMSKQNELECFPFVTLSSQTVTFKQSRCQLVASKVFLQILEILRRAYSEEHSSLFCFRVMDKDRKLNKLISGRQSVFLFEGINIDLNESDNWCSGHTEE